MRNKSIIIRERESATTINNTTAAYAGPVNKRRVLSMKMVEQKTAVIHNIFFYISNHFTPLTSLGATSTGSIVFSYGLGLGLVTMVERGQ